MKMSELSDRSCVSIASIKFYKREGLLPEAEHSSPNQAQYTEQHVRRLRLTKALIEVGGLSVASVRLVFEAVDADIPLDWVFGVAQQAIPRSMEASPAAQPGRGAADVAALAADRGWHLDDANPGIAMATRVIDSYVELQHEELLAVLPVYAAAAELVAEADLAAVLTLTERDSMAETVVVGTVLGDTLFAGLRRMAQENRSHQIAGGTAP